MPRLFIGLEIPDDLRQTLSLLRGGLPGARWIDPENYHLTLRFIGDIDAGLAHEIVSMLGRVNRRPFDVRLDGLSSFGGHKPRAIVASVAPSPSLLELQAELERLMQRVGLEPEGRKYTPHVTLARLRDSSSRQVADYLATRGLFRSAAFRVERFVLYSSRASVGGGPYVVEEAYPLERAVREARRSDSRHDRAAGTAKRAICVRMVCGDRSCRRNRRGRDRVSPLRLRARHQRAPPARRTENSVSAVKIASASRAVRSGMISSPARRRPSP